MSGNQETWVIILAGGEGTRLAPLTRALYGTDLPKQFAVLEGDRSLLQQTVERALGIVPAPRVVVVVSAHREVLARAQLAPYAGVHLLAQPASLDTGPGLLLPLAYVRARAADAHVTVMPADHHLPNPQPLYDAVARAGQHRDARRRVTLVGVAADHPETEYGWIVPGERIAGRGVHTVTTIRRFVEKPAADIAARLHRRGAVWNTFIATGRLAAFWDLAERRLPHHARAFADWAAITDAPAAARRLRELYAVLPRASWSADVVARTPGHMLALTAMSGSGWSDWGAPRRVFESLAGTQALDSLLARVKAMPPLHAP